MIGGSIEVTDNHHFFGLFFSTSHGFGSKIRSSMPHILSTYLNLLIHWADQTEIRPTTAGTTPYYSGSTTSKHVTSIGPDSSQVIRNDGAWHAGIRHQYYYCGKSPCRSFFFLSFPSLCWELEWNSTHQSDKVLPGIFRHRMMWLGFERYMELLRQLYSGYMDMIIRWNPWR